MGFQVQMLTLHQTNELASLFTNLGVTTCNFVQCRRPINAVECQRLVYTLQKQKHLGIGIPQKYMTHMQQDKHHKKRVLN